MLLGTFSAILQKENYTFILFFKRIFELGLFLNDSTMHTIASV